jgi:hypothetical protein
MKFGKWMCLTPLTLLVALAISHDVAAQGPALQTNKPKHHTYKLIDLGTLDGTRSYFNPGSGNNLGQCRACAG